MYQKISKNILFYNMQLNVCYYHLKIKMKNLRKYNDKNICIIFIRNYTRKLFLKSLIDF